MVVGMFLLPLFNEMKGSGSKKIAKKNHTGNIRLP
jgi:hypothetical protein